MVTRRWYYVVPAEGEPRKLVHRIEAGHLDSLPGTKREYSSLAGAVRKSQVHAGAVPQRRHAVLAQQHQCSRLAGGCRHGGTGAQLRQEHRQLRRPGLALRGHAASTSRSRRTSPPARRSTPSPPPPSRKSGAACATAAPTSSTSRSFSPRRSSARTWSPTTCPSSPSMPTPATRITALGRASFAHPRGRPRPARRLGEAEHSPAPSITTSPGWASSARRHRPKQREIFEVVKQRARCRRGDREGRHFRRTANRRLGSGQGHARRDRDRRLRKILHPSHRPFHRHRSARQRRQHGQSGNPRRARRSCPTPASPSSPESTCPNSACAAR